MGITANDVHNLEIVWNTKIHRNGGGGLQAGDILIHHGDEGKDWAEGIIGTFHCSILTSPNFRYHSTFTGSDPAGVRFSHMNGFSDAAAVFRLKDPNFSFYSKAAAKIAEKWGTGSNKVGYRGGKNLFKVVGHTLNTAIRSSSYGSDAKERLKKYKDRPDCRPKHVICSEFVVLCYQLAMEENSPAYPRIDAKHCSPKYLEDYLMDSTHWDLIGVAAGEDYF